MQYNVLATQVTLNKTIAALTSKGIEAISVSDETSALKKLKSWIPTNASVTNGASVTLEQIGFVEYLKSGNHPWSNLHAAIVAEKDPVKQGILRKQALLSDYYVGSVHALIENGEFVIASNTGSQLPHVVYSSPNLIFVVGTQKIVPDFTQAMKRLEEYVVPLEDKHMKQLYGVGTVLNKVVLFKGESSFTGRKIRMILVKKLLGF
jgi:hypothetical protein